MSYASQWFERCGFGMFPTGLLAWISNSWEYDIDGFVCLLKDIEKTKNELEDTKEHPEKYDVDEIVEMKDDLEEYLTSFFEIKSAFIEENEEDDWEKEVEKVLKWKEEAEQLLGEK